MSFILTTMNQENIQGDGFIIENLTPEIAEFKKPFEGEYTGFDKGKHLIFDYGQKKSTDILEAQFLFKSDIYTISNTSASCGCTNPRVTDVTGGQLVTVRFQSGFVGRNISKWFTLWLNRDTKQLKFNLQMNM